MGHRDTHTHTYKHTRTHTHTHIQTRTHASATHLLPTQVLTSKDFVDQLSADVEVNAMVEFHVAMAAHKFVGHALHPFSSLAIVQRRHG